MNELGCFFGFIIAVALAIWAFVALLRRLPGPDLRRRLESVELEVAQLRSDIAALRTTGTVVTSEAPATPPLAPETPVLDPPAAESPPAPAVDVVEADEAPVSSPPPSSPVQPATGVGATSGSQPASPPDDGPPQTEEPGDSVEPSEAPRPPAPTIDWEQWLGVRGAAVLGGIALAIAGALLVRVGIQAGLVTPGVRVILTMLGGITALVTSELLRKRDVEVTANALAGAGVVLLYGATWAARNLYELIGAPTAFALMALVTVAGGALSMRYRSMVIALLGLLGGFATPLLISADSDQPLGLFGYLLLLNAGVAFLGRKRNWPILSVLGLGATAFYQLLWIAGQMEERIAVGLLILGIFALFYVVLGLVQRRNTIEPQGGLSVLTEIGGVASPFAFAFYFAAHANFVSWFPSLAGLLLLLCASAVYLSRVHKTGTLAVGAAAASFAVIVIWWLRIDHDASRWPGVIALVVFSALFHLFFERNKSRESNHLELRPAMFMAIASSGWLALSSIVRGISQSSASSPWWILLGGLVVVIALLLRQAALIQERRGTEAEPEIPAWMLNLLELWTALVAATFIVGGLWGTGSDRAGHPSAYVIAALGLGAGVGHLAWSRATLEHRPYRPLATVAYVCVVLLGMMAGFQAIELTPWHGLIYAAAVGLIGVLAATAGSTGIGYTATLFATALSHLFWTDAANETPAVALVIGFATVALFLYWPIAVPRFNSAAAFRAAALTGPLWFPFLWDQWRSALGEGAVGLLPVVLGAMTIGAVRWIMSRPSDDPKKRLTQLVWFSAVALGFVAIAIPMQLDREWVTVGWAILGFFVTLLWKRLDHAGLKYFGLLLHAAVFVRLIVNPELFTYHPVGAPFGLPVLNWLLYTYLVPAVAVLLSARALLPVETERAKPWESWYQSLQRPIIATLYGLMAVILGFWWINLTIYDAFAATSALEITFDRRPARDLALSLSWAVYALVLLGFGVARKSSGLRWTSLVVLIVTIGKVFLYDLGELSDLYRVFSLLGLSVSLILVSLLYQRFVFRGSGQAPSSQATDSERPDEEPDLSHQRQGDDSGSKESRE